MQLVQIETASAVYNIDVDDPALCRDFDHDCARVLDYDFCALYDPEQGQCPFITEA